MMKKKTSFPDVKVSTNLRNDGDGDGGNGGEVDHEETQHHRSSESTMKSDSKLRNDEDGTRHRRSSSFSSESKSQSLLKPGKEEGEEKNRRKSCNKSSSIQQQKSTRLRSKSSSSSILNFMNMLRRISNDHGAPSSCSTTTTTTSSSTISSLSSSSRRRKKRNYHRMNFISKLVTPCLLLALFYSGFISSILSLNIVTCIGVVFSILWLPTSAGLEKRVNYAFGFLLFTNWFVFWMIPIVVQGAAFKLGLQSTILKPLYDILDKSTWARTFASRYVYKKSKYTDFFATQVFFILSTCSSLALIMYYHQTQSSLPFYVIMMYNFAWIGPGGRSMGAAYSIAHKEGHFDIYNKSLKSVFGNLFENVLGVFYGSVPCNFTTTHISIHHRLDAGRGDTLYNWDISRSSVPSFMLYLVRGLLHTSGLGGLYQFYFSPRKRDRTSCVRENKKIQKKCALCLHYFAVPLILLLVSHSH